MKNSKLFTVVGIVGFVAVIALSVGVIAAVAVAIGSTLIAIVGGRDYQDIPTVMDNPQPYLYVGL